MIIPIGCRCCYFSNAACTTSQQPITYGQIQDLEKTKHTFSVTQWTFHFKIVIELAGNQYPTLHLVIIISICIVTQNTNTKDLK